MDAKIRYIVGTSSHQVIFTQMEQIDQPMITAKIIERYSELEQKIKEKAAYHLLSNIVGAEHAGFYTVSFNEAKREST
jgi:hypothetical protein